ncbi:hypothetical protein ACFQDN_25230 [Pseudomonas asuensis]|uniref:Secreted protein n=1 Tax=Pseudomonas asuensis TaxID=1825787 RepID=A0ABQ2H0H4_9PSED|nr:hypothetical protein [Pseudomonas asuensis]GGM20063.1 hypothetical protein GCM10009425_33590 [Pseudomonas asuensis]
MAEAGLAMSIKLQVFAVVRSSSVTLILSAFTCYCLAQTSNEVDEMAVGDLEEVTCGAAANITARVICKKQFVATHKSAQNHNDELNEKNEQLESEEALSQERTVTTSTSGTLTK